MTVTLEARKIFALAWPAMLTSTAWTLMQMIDIAILQQSRPSELAKLAGARALILVFVSMMGAGLCGVLTFSAIASGAGQKQELARLVRSSLMFATVSGTFLAFVIAAFGRSLLLMMGVESQLDGTLHVLYGMIIALPPLAVAIALSMYLEAIGKPIIVVAVNLLLMPLNAILAWQWASKTPLAGASGALGIVLASSTITMLGAAILLCIVMASCEADELDVTIPMPRTLVWQLAGFGILPAISTGLQVVGIGNLIARSLRLEHADVTAFQIMMAMQNIGVTIASGFATAAGVRVANAIGENDARSAQHRAVLCLAICLAIVAFFAFGTTLIYNVALDWWPLEKEVAISIRREAAFIAIWTIAVSFQLMLSAVMVALKDQIVAAACAIFGSFAIIIMVSFATPMGLSIERLVLCGIVPTIAVAFVQTMRLAYLRVDMRYKSLNRDDTSSRY
ncbi:MAG TPA: MATE family efflux transporter [Sphingobium sp.]